MAIFCIFVDKKYKCTCIYMIYITCRMFISIQQLQRRTNNENKDKYLVKWESFYVPR